MTASSSLQFFIFKHAFLGRGRTLLAQGRWNQWNSSKIQTSGVRNIGSNDSRSFQPENGTAHKHKASCKASPHDQPYFVPEGGLLARLTIARGNPATACGCGPPKFRCNRNIRNTLSADIRLAARPMSTNNGTPAPASKSEQLKRAVKDYGSAVVVFHVTLSLASLGTFYAVVSSGIDAVGLVSRVPYIGDQLGKNSVAAGASTFVVAYAVHKVFAPVRISATLAATPFIVRYFRLKRSSKS